MTESEWLACDAPEAMLSAVLRVWKRPSGRKLRLFACACCRHVPAIINAEFSPVMIDAVEKFADGHIDNVTLSKTLSAARVVGDARWSLLTELTPRYVEKVRSETASYATDGIAERRYQANILRDIFAPRHFRAGAADALVAWRTDTALVLARQMYDSRDFSAMPILADALLDADCDNDDILSHCRDANQVHVRGCWVVDLVLGKS